MGTETFKAKHLETREDSVHVEYLGKRVFLPRSEIEKMEIVDGHVTVTVPFWLYKSNFEDGK